MLGNVRVATPLTIVVDCANAVNTPDAACAISRHTRTRARAQRTQVVLRLGVRRVVELREHRRRIDGKPEAEMATDTRNASNQQQIPPHIPMMTRSLDGYRSVEPCAVADSGRT
jgi:hypothetical protein